MINVAVIGCGYWGPNLIRNLAYHPEVRLYALCDLSKERLDRFRAVYPNVFFAQDYTKVLSNHEVDAVVVATEAGAHYQITKDSLLADKDVLVEKPLALKEEEGKELVELAKNKERILMVGHTFLYNSAVRELKKLITDGELGRIYYTYSRRVNLGRVKTDINAMWNLCPHDLSILLYLFGSFPHSISAQGECFLQKDIEDVVFVILRFPNGLLSQIHVSWLDPNKVRMMTIVGDKKMIVYDDVDNEAKLKIYDKGVAPQEPYDTFGEFQFKLRGGDIHIPKIDLFEPLREECSHFIECVKTRKRPLSDGEHGLKVLKLLEYAQLSLNNGGREVEVPQ